MSDSLIDLGGLQVGAEHFLVAVLETTAQPIWVVDPDGVIRFANPAAIAALGYDSAEELTGLHSHDTIHHSHPDGKPYPAADCPMLLPRATGETVTSDLDWFFRRDGSMFPVSYVSVPLEMPDGRGAVVAFTDIEDRLRAERELREREEILTQEQAALRRVATLVAGGAPPPEVFAAVAHEAARVTGSALVQIQRFESDDAVTVAGAYSAGPHPFQPGTKWGLEGSQIAAAIKRTGRSVRVDDFGEGAGPIQAGVREARIRGGAGAPIVVDGEVWGCMAAGPAAGDPVPEGLEDRLAGFTEIVATAISDMASREALARLAHEQAALRRVATLVAEGVSPSELLGAVTEEVGKLLDVDLAGMIRYVDDDTITPVGAWAAEGEHPAVEGLWPLEGDVIATTILRTRRPARTENWAQVGGPIADFVVNVLGVRSSVGSPIVVEGRVWGALFVHSKRPDRPLARDTESRLTNFAELVATAMSNAQARAEVERLAEEQAALRRVATLVARESSPTEVFGAVADEVARNLGSGAVGMLRFEPDGTATLVAQSDTPWDPPPLGARFTLEGENVVASVLRTRKAVRLDDWANATGAVAEMARVLGIRSSVAIPVIVEGRLWGTMIAVTDQIEPLPADTESRLGQVTELVATAIANAEARGQVLQLVKEQAALRRVATMVARGVPPADVFEAIVREAGRLLGVDAMHMGRYDGAAAISVAGWSRAGDHLPVGTRVELDGTNLASLVLQSGRPERIDGYSAPTGGTADRLRDRMRVYSSVAVPIVVDGRLWGLTIASSQEEQPLPADTESRLVGFIELAEMAISNTEARTQLAASRARLVAAADEERRRVVRDLHDGAQQRLVHTIVTMKLARRALERGDDARPPLAEGLEQAERANAELRELAHGILPTVLAHGGLRAGVEALASRTPVPVDISVHVGRLAATLEATAYFVVAEALTNVAKHSRADRAQVTAGVEDGALRLRVRDDGVGGAQPEGGGLVGLADRVAALGGRFHVESPPGRGTLVAADIPVPDEPARTSRPPTYRADWPPEPEPGGSPAPAENSSASARA